MIDAWKWKYHGSKSNQTQITMIWSWRFWIFFFYCRKRRNCVIHGGTLKQNTWNSVQNQNIRSDLEIFNEIMHVLVHGVVVTRFQKHWAQYSILCGKSLERVLKFFDQNFFSYSFDWGSSGCDSKFNSVFCTVDKVIQQLWRTLVCQPLQPMQY